MASYLLDTHILVWLVDTPEKLSKKAKKIILDSNNRLYYSLLSMNEIAIKVSIGKMTMVDDWQELYRKEFQKLNIDLLPLDWRAVNALQNLPFHHKDPFDRMLIAHAMVNELTFISADNDCVKYDLPVIWQ